MPTGENGEKVVQDGIESIFPLKKADALMRHGNAARRNMTWALPEAHVSAEWQIGT